MKNTNPHKCKHGGSLHQKIVNQTASEFEYKGYEVTLDGERSQIKKYRGLPRFDIFAENEKELLLVECGWCEWVMNAWRERTINYVKKTLEENESLKNKNLRFLWIPYLYSLAIFVCCHGESKSYFELLNIFLSS
jgi:hypothetical protein